MRTLENTLDACESQSFIKDLCIFRLVWFMDNLKRKLLRK